MSRFRFSDPLGCRWYAILLLALSTCLIGCEENLQARDDLPTPYSMDGVLSPDFDTQSIRLYPLESTPTLGLSSSLEVDVTTTDLNTGVRHAWRDTVVVDPNGQHEYIFWASFTAE